MASLEGTTGWPRENSVSSMFEVHFGGCTDAGRVRSRNEDNFSNVCELNLFIVADGMGGHRCGDEASRQACLEVEDYLASRVNIIKAYENGPSPLRRKEVIRLVQDAVRAASEKIVLEAEAHPDRQGMATTLVLAIIIGGRAFVAHVGDSRAYLIREGRAELLTEDHSLFFELVRQGKLPKAAAASFPYKNVVTRALGVRGGAAADVVDFDLWPGDRLLLCTDGLHSYADEGVLARFAATGSPEQVARRLVDYANECGGTDNITVVVVEIRGEGVQLDVLRQRQRLLASIPLFANLSLGDRLRLVSLCETTVLEDGEVLFREGDLADGLFAVLTGQVEVRRGGEVLATFGPGTELGEISLLDRQPRLVSGVARGRTEVLHLTKSAFETVLRKSPVLGSRLLANVARILSARLREANDELALLRAHYSSKGIALPTVLPSSLLVEDPE